MRRVYAWLAAGLIAFAVYGSLLPFRLRPRPFGAAWSMFLAALASPHLERASRTNLLANALLFVPVGFCLMGARLAGRPRDASAVVVAAAALIVSVAVSTIAEFLQVFAPGRVPSALDIVAQSIGCAIGIVVWLAAGPSLTAWLQTIRDPGARDRWSRLLMAYAVLWLFAGLAPFDVTLDVGEIGHRLRSGLINFVPFGAPMPRWRQAWDVTAAALSSIPIGVFGLVGGTSRSGRRSAASAWGLGALAVVALESAQVFIQSHGADITDVLFGWLGVAIGVFAGTRLFDRIPAASSTPLRGTRPLAIAATAVWALVIVAYHWQPFDFGIDTGLVREKLAQMSLMPFAGYRAGSELNAFSNLLSKIAVAVPLGVFGAFVVPQLRRLPPAAIVAIWTTIAGAFFGIVEIGQIFVPSRVPDPTDVLVGVAASLAGLWIGRWVQERRH